MKKGIIAILISSISLLSLTACTVETPLGTFNAGFNSAQKSENVKYTDETGKTQEINTQDLNQQIDNMLDDVDLPQGATTDDLKEFVHGTTEAIGVDKAIEGIQETLDSATNEALSEENTDETNSETESGETTENTDTITSSDALDAIDEILDTEGLTE